MDAKAVKDTTSMADVVRRYGIQINRAGFCRCPFHDEKTASMKVYAKSWYCFGCGAGGDVFDFVRRYEKCGFPKALEILGGSPSKRTGADMLAAYNRDAERRRRRKRTAEAAEKLHAAFALLDACRDALAIVPDGLKAAALAYYYFLQDAAADAETEYFNAKEGSA